jgi:hypothetical protein
MIWVFIFLGFFLMPARVGKHTHGPRGKSSRGLEHSKTPCVIQTSAYRAKRLGLRQPSAALLGPRRKLSFENLNDSLYFIERIGL